jgi:hypothetical protein
MHSLLTDDRDADIDTEYTLPMITIHYELVKLDPLQRVQYNGLLASTLDCKLQDTKDGKKSSPF